MGTLEIMTDADINRIIFKWFVFWSLTITGLALLGAVILIPMLAKNQQMVYEYEIIKKQVSQINHACKKLRIKTAAIGEDPQFTEDVIRKELNLPKKGVETITIAPEKIKFGTQASSDNYWILDHANQWWLRPFLQSKNKLWLTIISAGLILGAIISSLRPATDN